MNGREKCEENEKKGTGKGEGTKKTILSEQSAKKTGKN